MPYEDLEKHWLRVLDNLEYALDHPNDPHVSTEGLMTRWGALMVESSQRAFVDQRFGDYEWPPRYPGMEPPFLNIAGAIADFASGRTKPKPNRFQDRPALVDEGMRGGLWGSISFNVPSPHDVEVGSPKDYAKLQNDGGESEVKIDQGAFDRAKEWLFHSRAPFYTKKGKDPYVQKIWPAMVRWRMTGENFHQQVAARPFLGVTARTAEYMIRATEEYFQGEQRGGAASAAG